MLRPKTSAFLLILLAGGLASIGMAFGGQTGKWLTSTGLLFDIAGIVQLDLSGLFDEIIRRYGNEKDFPYGPPSHITRQIIDNPDTPVRTWLLNTLFFDRRTGFYLMVTGFAFQLAGAWL